MALIYKIAKAELRRLFSSPIAWLLLLVLAIQFGIRFCDVLALPVRDQALGDPWQKLTSEIFWDRFAYILKYLYFYIPLLTMGLMSKEYGSGSVKLLFSSPITNGQIVLGKYLAMVLFALLMVGVIVPYVVFAACVIEHLDFGFVLSNLLGMFLLICAYAAIGFFVSALTSNQIVSAIATLALLSLLSLIGQIGQETPVIKDITYWLAFSQKTRKFVDGLVCSEYVIYFLTVVVLFLVMTYWHLQHKRTRQRGMKVGLKYVCLFFVVALIAYGASHPKLTFYADVTRNKSNTISPVSQKLLSQLDGDLKLVTYVNVLGKFADRGLPKAYRDDFERFRKYIRFKPDLKMKYVYYYEDATDFENARQKAEKYCKAKHLNFDRVLSHEELSGQVDLSREKERLVRQFVWKDSVRVFLRMFDDNQVFPREREIATALKCLVEGPAETIFLTGHGERGVYHIGDIGYSRFSSAIGVRDALVNQGYVIREWSLETDDLPGKTDLLVIADPKKPFSHIEVQRLEKYIQAGGNLMVLGSAGQGEVLNPLLKTIGVSLLDGKLVQKSQDVVSDKIMVGFTQDAAMAWPDAESAYRIGERILFSECTGLRVAEQGFECLPIVKTKGDDTWNVLRTDEMDASYPLVIALQRIVGDREQRIVVAGDAEWLSNGGLSHARERGCNGNIRLLWSIFKWLANEKYPVMLTSIPSLDNRIALKRRDIPKVKACALGGYSILILSVWGIYRSRRKRR